MNVHSPSGDSRHQQYFVFLSFPTRIFQPKLFSCFFQAASVSVQSGQNCPRVCSYGFFLDRLVQETMMCSGLGGGCRAHTGISRLSEQGYGPRTDDRDRNSTDQGRKSVENENEPELAKSQKLCVFSDGQFGTYGELSSWASFFPDGSLVGKGFQPFLLPLLPLICQS